MNFQPVVPLGGYAGWAFLARTKGAQQEAFAGSPAVDRETKYFEKNIAEIQTAEQLVNDRTLLKIALGAFGLDDDLNNRFFIRKVLEDGSLTEDALANKLADKRYLELTKAFGFGDFSVPRTVLSTFAAEITAAYKTRQFEIAVGDQNASMRLALGLERDLAELAQKSTSNPSKWFTIMGTPPLREVFEAAFGLPTSFGALDIDRQYETLAERARSVFGSDDITQFAEPERMEELVRLYLARSEIQGIGATIIPGSVALALLQSSGLGGRLLP